MTTASPQASLIRKLPATRLEQEAAKQKSHVRPAADKTPGWLGVIDEEVNKVEEVTAELRKNELESLNLGGVRHWRIVLLFVKITCGVPWNHLCHNPCLVRQDNSEVLCTASSYCLV